MDTSNLTKKKPARPLQRSHHLVARFQEGDTRLLSQGPLSGGVARTGKWQAPGGKTLDRRCTVKEWR